MFSFGEKKKNCELSVIVNFFINYYLMKEKIKICIINKSIYICEKKRKLKSKEGKKMKEVLIYIKKSISKILNNFFVHLRKVL